MMRGRKYVPLLTFTATLVLLACVQLTSCSKNLFSPTQTQVVVTVSVSTVDGDTSARSVSYRTQGSAFVSQLRVLKLMVFDETGTLTRFSTTTNFTNPTFSFELVPATYTFVVEGENLNGRRILRGERVFQVRRDGENVVTILTEFENGTLRVHLEVDEVVWGNYEIGNARIALFRRSTNQVLHEAILVEGRQSFWDKLLTPGIWDVTLSAELIAKHGGVLPSFKQVSRTVSVQVDPSEQSYVFFRIVFDTEPNLVGWTGSVALPFETPVQDLVVVWKSDENEAHVGWHHATPGVNFDLYKKVLITVGEATFTRWEHVVSTSSTRFVVQVSPQEHDNLLAFGVNASMAGRESGLVVTNRADFKNVTDDTIGRPILLSANYNGDTMTVRWQHDGLATSYRIYKKLSGSSSWQFVGETTRKEASFPLNQSEYSLLEKIGVSVVYHSFEKRYLEVEKRQILPFDGGNGSSQSPFLVSTAWQLRHLGTSDYLNKGYHFKLVADVDLANVSWSPLGAYSSDMSSAFRGTFDGNGKRIVNLRIVRTDVVLGVGLFGCVNESTITNLVLENAEVGGVTWVGAAVGYAKNSTLRRVGVRNSVVRGKYYGASYSVIIGGLVGATHGGLRLEECFASNVVVHQENPLGYAGGLVGRMGQQTGSNLVSRSYATGVLKFPGNTSTGIGGLVGFTAKDSSSAYVNGISESYAAVEPFNEASNGGPNAYWKGFVGYNPNFQFQCANPGLKNYFDKDVSRETSGSLNPSLQEGKTTVEMMQSSTYQGWNFSEVWTIREGETYPRLRWEF